MISRQEMFTSVGVGGPIVQGTVGKRLIEPCQVLGLTTDFVGRSYTLPHEMSRKEAIAWVRNQDI